MGKYELGELQELVLLVIGNLGEDAYGLAIRKFLSEKVNRKISLSAIHSTLHRLEQKGMVESSYQKGQSSKRGGRPKLIFTITASGKSTLEKQRETRNLLWNGIQLAAFKS